MQAGIVLRTDDGGRVERDFHSENGEKASAHAELDTAIIGENCE